MPKKCKHCDGTGEVPVFHSYDEDGNIVRTFTGPCEACQGDAK